MYMCSIHLTLSVRSADADDERNRRK